MTCDYCHESVIHFSNDLAESDPKFFGLLSERYPNFADDYTIPLSLTDRTMKKTKSANGTVVCLCDRCYHRIKIVCRGHQKISEAIEVLINRSAIKIR
jgi:hypothetical protein